MIACLGVGFIAQAETLDRQPQKAEERTASLFIENTDKKTKGYIYRINIMVDPGGQAINTVGLNLNFSKEKLEVTDIDVDNSFCDMFIDNTFDNKTGEIKIACGKPYPGIDTTAQIATVTFAVKQKGLLKFNFSDDSVVLANDGFGTDVLESANNKSIYLK